MAYTAGSATSSGGATGAPTSTSKGLSAAAIAGISFIILMLGAGAYFGLRYYRAQAADRVHQYETIDTGGSAMTTISVPATYSMNLSGSSEEEGAGAGRGGMLGGLRHLFGSGSGAQGGKGYKGLGLASTADHSELDDRVNTFL